MVWDGNDESLFFFFFRCDLYDGGCCWNCLGTVDYSVQGPCLDSILVGPTEVTLH